MKNINFSFKEALLLGILVLSFLFLWYADTFIDSVISSDTSLEESRAAAASIASTSQMIESLKFDTSILKNNFFISLLNLPEFPLDVNSPLVFGKVNPFTGSYVIVATTTGTVGGIRPAFQQFSSTTPIFATSTASTTLR